VTRAVHRVRGRQATIRRIVSQINYRSTGGHWPGLNGRFRDNYVAKFEGHLRISRNGLYTFWTESDDGSWLLINGRRVVNNDGLHGMRQHHGRTYLRVGQSAKIGVWFFERGGGAGLKVYWSGPGFGKRIISRSDMRSGVLSQLQKAAIAPEARAQKQRAQKQRAQKQRAQKQRAIVRKERAEVAKVLTAKRNASWKDLLQKVEQNGLYLSPSEYSSQYLQIDLCSLREDAPDCSDTCMHELGLKSTLGCGEVNDRCPSCSCKPQHITAIATQGNPLGSSTIESEWVSEYLVSFLMAGENGKEQWRFYSSQGTTDSMVHAKILQGGVSKDDVYKNYFTSPVLAKAVRIHPVCWYGRAMSLRVELFQCLNEFSWKGLEENLASTGVGSFKHTTDTDKRLGEGRRGGAFLSTQGSFTLSAGNRAGNSERQLDLGSSNRTEGSSNPVAAAEATTEAVESNQTDGSSNPSDNFLESLATEVGKVNRGVNRSKKKKGAGDSAGGKEQQDKRKQQAAADRAASQKQQPTGGKGAARAATGAVEAAESQLPLSPKPMVPCSDILKATAPAFELWTLGMGGSGAIYQTFGHEVYFGGKMYAFSAYQRRVVAGAGLLQKQLVCYRLVNSTEQETCCVGKNSKPLYDHWPQQSLETKLL